MNEPETGDDVKLVSTIEALEQLGFQPASDPANPFPCHAFDFGEFVLYCHKVTNLFGETSIWFSGVLSTPRTMSQVDFTIPEEIHSVDQCAAIIAYGLDRTFHKAFNPEPPVEWLVEGRRNKHLLPWVIARAKKELEDAPFLARPRCLVQHEWARHAINTLKIYLKSLDENSPVAFRFEDSVLRITCHGTDYVPELIAVAADGSNWPSQYSVLAGRLNEFPVRSRGFYVDFSIWKGKLMIDDMKYDLIEQDVP